MKNKLHKIGKNEVEYHALDLLQPGMIVAEGIVLSTNLTGYTTAAGEYEMDDPEMQVVTVYGRLSRPAHREYVEFLQSFDESPITTPSEVSSGGMG